MHFLAVSKFSSCSFLCIFHQFLWFILFNQKIHFSNSKNVFGTVLAPLTLIPFFQYAKKASEHALGSLDFTAFFQLLDNRSHTTGPYGTSTLTDFAPEITMISGDFQGIFNTFFFTMHLVSEVFGFFVIMMLSQGELDLVKPHTDCSTCIVILQIFQKKCTFFLIFSISYCKIYVIL